MSSPIGSPLPKRVLNGSPSSPYTSTRYSRTSAVDRPLVEEGDLVEPAALAGDRVMHHGAAALPGAQSTVGLPLELDRIGATVGFHGAPVVGPERLRNGRTDLVVVAARQQPAFPLEPLDQILGQGLQHGLANQTRRSRRRWWGR